MTASSQAAILTRVSDYKRRSLRGTRRFFRTMYGVDPQPTEAQVEELKRFLLMGDPLADAVVAMYQQLPAGEGRRLLDRALQHGIDAASGAPPALVELFAQLDQEPIWLDREKLKLACEVSRRVGSSAELVLRNLSLMGGYLGGASAKPLVFTGQLDQMAPRRLVETTKFWLDVTTVGGLERFAEGFKSSVRVRIMHAQVRAMLLASGRWNMEWGHPLNQADSMGTILEFSSIFLAGLRALGFRFRAAEREAVIHLWRYVGYLLGVDERILPSCEADAIRAMYITAATAPVPDADSRALGRALADVPLRVAKDGWLGQRLAHLERDLRIGYTRYVLGDRAGDSLGLPRTAAKYVWPAQLPLRFGAEVLRANIPPLHRAMVRWGVRAIDRQFPREVARTGADTSFTPVSQLAR